MQDFVFFWITEYIHGQLSLSELVDKLVGNPKVGNKLANFIGLAKNSPTFYHRFFWLPPNYKLVRST